MLNFWVTTFLNPILTRNREDGRELVKGPTENGYCR
jgi:hypothetical protein